MTATTEQLIAEARQLAAREPLDIDISDYGNEFCAGYLKGQVNAINYIDRLLADRLEALTAIERRVTAVTAGSDSPSTEREQRLAELLAELERVQQERDGWERHARDANGQMWMLRAESAERALHDLHEQLEHHGEGDPCAVCQQLKRGVALEKALREIAATSRWYADNDARLQHEVDHALCVEIVSCAEDALAALSATEASK